jgi:hypothetical protein
MMDIAGLMKKAQAVQAEMEKVKSKLEETEVTGVSGGGMVAVTLNGKNQAKKVEIEASVINPDEKEILEDLLVAAINDARDKVEGKMQEEMAKVSSSLGLPSGAGLPF